MQRPLSSLPLWRLPGLLHLMCIHENPTGGQLTGPGNKPAPPKLSIKFGGQDVGKLNKAMSTALVYADAMRHDAATAGASRSASSSMHIPLDEAERVPKLHGRGTTAYLIRFVELEPACLNAKSAS